MACSAESSPDERSVRAMTAAADIALPLANRARWGALETVFWTAAILTLFLAPSRHLILTQVAVLGLFALSLDLILGYAGILSLGHAAFFGLGAYTAGLLAAHAIIAEPLLALIAAGAIAALFGLATSVLILRGSDLTRLMVTLGVALLLRELANKLDWLTGGADGLQGIVMAPLLGLFAFDIAGHLAYAYSLAVLFTMFLLARRLMNSPFGLSLRAVKANRLRCAAIGIAVDRRLIAIYGIAAGYAGIAGALLTQTTQFASLDVLGFERSADVLLVLILGGPGYLYGGLIGALVLTLVQDGLINLTARYWQFWIGLALVVIVLGGDPARRLFAALAPALGRLSSWRGSARMIGWRREAGR
jgi:branched-chain amino acid transport system permease protein